jgi:hypothetical protein
MSGDVVCTSTVNTRFSNIDELLKTKKYRPGTLVDYGSNVSKKRESLKFKKTHTHSAVQCT